MMLKKYRTLSKRIVYQNPWFKVREDAVVKTNGKKGKYNFIETYDSVMVVAMTDKREIYLVRLYRYPHKQFSWELPAGGSDGQKPLVAAKRELWEETGLKAKEWKKLGQCHPWNGMASETMHIFLAQDLVQSKHGKMAEEGITQVKKFPIKKVFEMVKRGQITDGQSLSAIMVLMQKI